jgi:hypothetical protein
MTRPVTLVALALAFLTAFAVGQVGMLVTNQNVANDPGYAEAPDTETIVRAFYDGIGSWITSGDRALDLMVTPEFIDHPMGGEPARDRAAFFSNLTSIRDSMPDLHLEITRIEAAGAIVSVDLTGSHGSLASMPGWSLELPAQVEFHEILRIEGHRIAERWHANDPWPYGFWSVERSLPVGAEQLRQPSIQRFELDPDAGAGLFVSGTVVVLVESGALSVDQSGLDLSGQEQPIPVPIRGGEVRIFEATGILEVRNQSERATRFWTVSLDQVLPPRLPPGAPASTIPIGIRHTANISVAVPLPRDGVALSLSGITLPSGTEIVIDGSGMHAVAITSGELQVESDSGEVFYRIDSTRYRAVGGGETATAGQGFAAADDGAATFRVTGDGPATLLLLTIAPVVSSPTQPSQPIRTGPG